MEAHNIPGSLCGVTLFIQCQPIKSLEMKCFHPEVGLPGFDSWFFPYRGGEGITVFLLGKHSAQPAAHGNMVEVWAILFSHVFKEKFLNIEQLLCVRTF